MAYSHGKNTTITINSVAYPFINATVSQDSANAETTNFLTSGDFDSIAGVKSVTISGTIVCDPTSAVYGTSAPVFGEGTVVTGTIAVSDGTASKTLAFTVRWDNVSFGLDVNDKVNVNVSGKGKITTRWS